MNKKIFLLLGGNKLNFGILKKFNRLGFLVFVVDWNEFPSLTGDRHYRIDVKDYKSIISELKKDGVWDRVFFAYSSIDLAVRSVAQINRELGLKTINDDGLAYSSSKSMMTKRWNELGLLNRISNSYTDFSEEIISLNASRNIIVKPDNSASSRGITIINKQSSEDIIKNAFKKACEEASDNIVVVEEFIEGTEFTVEMIGDAFGNVSVYAISRKTHTKNTVNNRIAVKLHYNAISDELQNRIAEFGIQCYKALHFSSSLGHLEVLMKADGTICPVEIGARSSGFIASDLVDIASGANFLCDLIKVQNGERVESGLHKQSQQSSMYFFYDLPVGKRIIRECNLLDFCEKSVKSRYFDRENLKEGNVFQLIDNDNARLGYEILEGPKSIMTRCYIDEAELKMLKNMFG